MADIPFLGCKISLISKCDIRYEGVLYCVDPKESTISLSKVRSYGTETRGDPANFVPPKNDVYDVIIFRASDVKDLRVDAPEPPGLSDPAIISARQSTNTTFDANPPTSSGPSQQGHQQKPLLAFLPTGPAKDQHSQQPSHRSQPVTNYSAAAASNTQRRARPDSRKSDNEVNNRKSEPSSGRGGGGPRRGGEIGGERRSDKRDIDSHDNDRRDDRRGRVFNDRRDYNHHHQHHDGRRNDGRPQPRMNRGGYDRNYNSNSRYNNNNNMNNRDRRGPSNRDDDSKGPMNRRRGGPMQGGRRGRSGDRTGEPRGPRKSAPLKFEGEYDFDEANKLFLELEGKFKNLKVEDGAKEENGEASGDRAASKSPTGRSESGSGYDSEGQNHKDGDSKDGFGGSVSGEFYDKSKSFFDNISCEANERGQGKIGRPDWRKERQTNAETFGISANYRRVGYRVRLHGTGGYRR